MSDTLRTLRPAVGVDGGWDNRRVAIDAGWFAVFGAAAGAAGNGIVEAVKLGLQSRADTKKRDHDAAEAKAKRAADAIDAAAQREHEREQRTADERRQKIRDWREGLAESHKEFKEWELVDSRVRRGEITGTSRNVFPEPNLFGTTWFQGLREYLSTDGGPNYYRTGSDIQCDDDAADVLGREISRIERGWLA